VALVFCTIGCWDSHVPLLRHRDAWATEKTSPTRAGWEGELAREAAAEAAASALNVSTPRAASAPVARPNPASPGGSPSGRWSEDASHAQTMERPQPVELASGADVPRDILVVASKLKAYVRARSGMNTSDGVLDVLSDRLRVLCDQAIRRAAEAGRKTVLDRDF